MSRKERLELRRVNRASRMGPTINQRVADHLRNNATFGAINPVIVALIIELVVKLVLEWLDDDEEQDTNG